MSTWSNLLAIARDFNWKPVYKAEGNAYPCGALQGWARPASTLSEETGWEDAGCICHLDLEQALDDWKIEQASKLLGQVGEIIRLVSAAALEMTTKRVQLRDHNILPRNYDREVQRVEEAQARLEQLVFRLQLRKRLRNLPLRNPQSLIGVDPRDIGSAEKFAELWLGHEPIDKPAPLAEPPTWIQPIHYPR